MWVPLSSLWLTSLSEPLFLVLCKMCCPEDWGNCNQTVPYGALPGQAFPISSAVAPLRSSQITVFDAHFLGCFTDVKVKWSCSVMSALCNPMDCNLPGSSVHGIFQARVLEWVAISFSRRSRPRDQTQVSRIVGRCFIIWATREVTDVKTPHQMEDINYLMTIST